MFRWRQFLSRQYGIGSTIDDSAQRADLSNAMRIGTSARLIRLSKIAQVITAILLVIVCVVLFHTNGIILFRTDRRIYDKGDHIRGVLTNLSRNTIEIRSSEPLIYELTSVGWTPPFFLYSSLYTCPHANQAGWMQPGSILSMNMCFLERKATENTWILLEQQYFYNENEYVVYSNRLVIDKFSQPLVFRTFPVGVIEVPDIRGDILNPYTVFVSNKSAQVIWFNSFCSDVDVDEWLTDYYPFATLQQRTSEGTWRVFRPDRSQCRTVSESIRIRSGETVELFLGDGYPASDVFEPGVYRWHLVYYPVPLSQCDDTCRKVSSGHLFTDAFEQ